VTFEPHGLRTVGLGYVTIALLLHVEAKMLVGQMIRTVQFVGQPPGGVVTITWKLHWSGTVPGTPATQVTVFVPTGKVEPLGGLQFTKIFDVQGLITVGAG
jgi:hypothetical protein